MRRPSTSRRGLRAAPVVLAVTAFLFAVAPAGALAFGPLSSFGPNGDGAGQAFGPVGVEVAADGTAYVSDNGNSRVDVFGPGGAFLFAFGRGVNPQGGDTCTALTGCKPGVADGSAGTIRSPEGIALGPEGNLFVASEDNGRVDAFTAAGAFLYAFGKGVNPGPGDPDVCTAAGGCRTAEPLTGAGALASPEGLGFDSAGRLFVADFGLDRVSAFTAAGAFLFAFGKNVNADPGAANPDLCTAGSQCLRGRPAGAAGGFSGPFDAAVSPGGEVFVSDFNNRRVDVFTAEGAFLRAFGKGVNPDPAAANADLCTAATTCASGAGGAAAGAFTGASGVALDAGGNVYVADARQNRISQFSAGGGFIRAFGTGVLDGANAFQICALACQAGTATQSAGSIPTPIGIAIDCHGVLYTTTETAAQGQRISGVKRFGEPVSPPCGQPTSPPAAGGKFRFGKLILDKRRGTAVLVVVVPGPGGLVLKGKGLRTVRRAAKAAGAVRLPIRPVGRAKRKLARTGAARLRATVTFTPTGGTAATKIKALRLKRSR